MHEGIVGVNVGSFAPSSHVGEEDCLIGGEGWDGVGRMVGGWPWKKRLVPFFVRRVTAWNH